MIRIRCLVGLAVLIIGFWSASATALESEELQAIKEYCGSIAEQSGTSGVQRAQLLDDCVQEQKAMLQEPEIVSEPPSLEVSPQMLEQCYRQVDAWLQGQVESGNDTLPEYDSLLDRCVENQGVLEP